MATVLSVGGSRGLVALVRSVVFNCLCPIVSLFQRHPAKLEHTNSGLAFQPVAATSIAVLAESPFTGYVNRSDYREALRKTQSTCFYCQRQLSLKQSNKKLNGYTIDHILARCRGGRDVRSNLVLACTECNRSKTNLLPQEWLEIVLAEQSRWSNIVHTIRHMMVMGVLDKLLPTCGREHKAGPAKTKKAKPVFVPDATVDKADFSTSKRKFHIVRKRDGLRLLKYLSGPDLAFYLDACGFDNNGQLLIQAVECWHPLIGGAFIQQEDN